MTLISKRHLIGDQVAIYRAGYFLRVQIVATRQKSPAAPILFVVQDFRQVSQTFSIEDFYRL